MRYLACIHEAQDCDFGASFPDFAGCISVGATIDEVADKAREALSLHAEGMLEDGETLPEPRNLQAILAEGVEDEVSSFIWVPLIINKAANKRVGINFNLGLLEAIDAEAANRGLTRSAFLAAAAMKELKAS